ncbi:hypothetical protein P152DRAFT_288559 [Eremomyces bilateralis CBS 781.70]|uniref:Uncharacterized protein n=1 Tax=Eremomyces bilateralis CBS 781.70 TaxID=1392243 RepID=A0A6G1G6U6_9PEZI|nr:uncharacterized protein P152DRAFT_288559 [Eremomyces bilateralis CBS 781.70]KAF1813681.1 hypothetical protein P152DRAFT_288559 [Eremomyces bilateralis CBS 781.70]
MIHYGIIPTLSLLSQGLSATPPRNLHTPKLLQTLQSRPTATKRTTEPLKMPCKEIRAMKMSPTSPNCQHTPTHPISTLLPSSIHHFHQNPSHPSSAKLTAPLSHPPITTSPLSHVSCTHRLLPATNSTPTPRRSVWSRTPHDTTPIRPTLVDHRPRPSPP